MTSGSVDDHLGSSIELARLVEQFPSFGDYLASAEDFDLNTEDDVPFVGGITFDGKQPLGDRNFNWDWNGLIIKPSIREHECVEWGLRKFCRIGVDYEHDPAGHRLANRAELDELVRQLYLQQVSDERRSMGEAELWKAYSAFVDPQVKGVESEQITSVNKQLALYPYKGSPLYEKLISLGVITEGNT
jgi:hypothetical protein